MFFDTTLQAFTANVWPNPEQHGVILHFPVAIIIPGPSGQGKQILPAGQYKVPIGYTLAKEFFEEGLKALEDVTPPSKLEVVQDPAVAEHVAAQAAAQAAAADALRSELAS